MHSAMIALVADRMFRSCPGIAVFVYPDFTTRPLREMRESV